MDAGSPQAENGVPTSSRLPRVGRLPNRSSVNVGNRRWKLVNSCADLVWKTRESRQMGNEQKQFHNRIIQTPVFMTTATTKDVSKIVFADDAIVHFSRLWGLVIRCSCKRYKNTSCCRHLMTCKNLDVLRAVNNISKICFVDNAVLTLSRLWGSTVRCTCKKFKQTRQCKHREMATSMAAKDPNHVDFRPNKPGFTYVS